MHSQELSKLIADNNIEFVELRFTDSKGIYHHLSLPKGSINEDFVINGHTFDGSSIAGWQGIECSDMLLKPDLASTKIDPFFERNTLFITCDVYDPVTNQNYSKCPRGIAKRAEMFLKESGIADTAYFGPEPEFFIFDSVTWDTGYKGCSVNIRSEEASWESALDFDGANYGHRPSLKGGYFPLPPVDSLQDIRSEICNVLLTLGIIPEVHHHEVATAGQCEIGTKFSTLVTRGDWSQIFKYVVKNVAHRYGKTATFMPKPIVGDNGSGMHVHQSLWKNGKNLFAGDLYAGLSQMALYYIGGIIKHAKSLNAITNPTTNSYKRLVPGYEAPVILAYSSRNRSAAIRIPFSYGDKAKRIEVRFPDPLANPYLAFSALMMAGIDGIINKIDPGKAMEINLYELNQEELKKIPQVSGSLEEALHNLSIDNEYLMRDNVFSREFLESFIKIKQEEVDLYRMTTHPIEFSMYYSL